MKEGLEKKLMLDLLTHPAEVIYKDDNIALIRPGGMESLAFHLGQGKGANQFMNSPSHRQLFRNDDPKYVVATRRGERILARIQTGAFSSRSRLEWQFSPYNTEERLLKKYPTLVDAFNDIAIKLSYLPLIKEHTKEVIEAAIKIDPANIRFVHNLTIKEQKYWIRQKVATFEYMNQNKELVQFAMANTDISLGQISSHFISASIAKQGIRKNPHDLRYVPNQHRTHELEIYAIKQDPSVLRHITHPSTDMYVAAVRSGKNAWEYVPDSLRKKVKKLA